LTHSSSILGGPCQVRTPLLPADVTIHKKNANDKKITSSQSKEIKITTILMVKEIGPVFMEEVIMCDCFSSFDLLENKKIVIRETKNFQKQTSEPSEPSETSETSEAQIWFRDADLTTGL
jgi:hypothetical protein